MAKSKTIRVFPDGNVWVAQKDGFSRASAVKNTKEEALQAARSIALNQNLSIIIHGKDGRIQKTVKPENTSEDNCYITTACVKYYNLSDDCSQLKTLRHFRDNYLQKSETDKQLVLKYYAIAPLIVQLLEDDKNKKELFDDIFMNINRACISINSHRFEEAKMIYKEVVVKLANHFKIG